jgi:hypothetical protein
LRHLLFSSVDLEVIKTITTKSGFVSCIATPVHVHLVFLIGSLLYHGRSTIPHATHNHPDFSKVPHAVPFQHNPPFNLWSVASSASPWATLTLSTGAVLLFTVICLAMAGHFQTVLAASDLSTYPPLPCPLIKAHSALQHVSSPSRFSYVRQAYLSS